MSGHTLSPINTDEAQIKTSILSARVFYPCKSTPIFWLKGNAAIAIAASPLPIEFNRENRKPLWRSLVAVRLDNYDVIWDQD